MRPAKTDCNFETSVKNTSNKNKTKTIKLSENKQSKQKILALFCRCQSHLKYCLFLIANLFDDVSLF